MWKSWEDREDSAKEYFQSPSISYQPYCVKSVILFKIAFQRYASPDDFEIYLELCQVTHVNSQISRYGKVFLRISVYKFHAHFIEDLWCSILWFSSWINILFNWIQQNSNFWIEFSGKKVIEYFFNWIFREKMIFNNSLNWILSWNEWMNHISYQYLPFLMKSPLFCLFWTLFGHFSYSTSINWIE